MEKHDSLAIDEQGIKDSRLVEHFEVHRDFTKIFLDAFILINSERKILKFNQAFCSMIKKRAIDVRKSESLDALLITEVLGSSDSAVSLILSSTSPMRIDEVAGFRKEDDERMQLIMSSYPYFDAEGVFLGACVVMRDVTAESSLQGKYVEKHQQSITDPLTGLYTRRFFEEWADKELERCHRTKEDPLVGILLFDLDKFKSINDTYGHQAGDFVLVETAKILKENARKTDIVGRYGGEELLVLLVGVDKIGACIAAEKFRRSIKNHIFSFDHRVMPVSASVGVTVFLTPQDTKEEAVKRADTCLYKAKDNGRNCCYTYFGSEEPVKTLDYLEKMGIDTEHISGNDLNLKK